MANNRCTYQQVTNVSIPKNKLLEVAANPYFSKKDYRVLLCLFTELDGWAPSPKRETKDPKNFKKIDIKSIASKLNISKKDVKKSLKNLMDSNIIEDGSSDTISNGYRFQF